MIKKGFSLLLMIIIGASISGCGQDGKRIVRISHGQAETHPQHLGLQAFEEHIEAQLGDKYDVQIFPNELLGSSVKAIELVQTGAIDFAVASTGNIETFDSVYQIFSMPYLFNNLDHYYGVMENKALITGIYKSTAEAGFEAVTWYDAGTRNFYATTPINTPEDLEGKKIRVQQSPTNVRMMELFGAAAAPMSFGEVYTAIQQKVIDGAENNELALTSNKHGEVAKYYTYNQHQMVPDLLIGNLRLLEGLSPEERQVFDEAAIISTRVERENWQKQVEEAKQQAEGMGVEFIYPEVEAFKVKVLPLHKEVLEQNDKLGLIYDEIQAIGQQLKEAK